MLALHLQSLPAVTASHGVIELTWCTAAGCVHACMGDNCTPTVQDTQHLVMCRLCTAWKHRSIPARVVHLQGTVGVLSHWARVRYGSVQAVGGSACWIQIVLGQLGMGSARRGLGHFQGSPESICCSLLHGPALRSLHVASSF